MKKLDIYILKELAGPFFFGVAAFSSIMIGSSLLFQMARYLIDLNMPIELVSRLFLWELPGVIVLTFPMATLLATLLAFSRMSTNSEVIAFKAGGVSFWRMVVPVIIVGLIVSLSTIYINERIVPFAKFESRRLLYEFTHNAQVPTTQKHLTISQLTKKGVLDYILYAEKFDGQSRSMNKVSYQDLDDAGRVVAVITAKEARWLENQWIFFDGEYVFFPAGDQPVIMAKFAQYEMKDIKRTPRQITLSERSKRPEELTLAELKEVIENKQAEGSDVKKIQVSYYQRFSIPLSCLIFALLGAPLGLQPNRSGSSIGLGLSIIVIFIYYIVLTIGASIGQTGLISPIFGAWLPNLLFGLVGIGLNHKVSS